MIILNNIFYIYLYLILIHENIKKLLKIIIHAMTHKMKINNHANNRGSFIFFDVHKKSALLTRISTFASEEIAGAKVSERRSDTIRIAN